MSNKWSWGALVPRSLLSRMILLLLLAMSAASTVNFFKSLPLQYRHIALDQLRNMGGQPLLRLAE